MTGFLSYDLLTRALQAVEESLKAPLYEQDRAIVDRLLSQPRPTEADLTDAGRLLVRYSGFPGADDLKSDLSQCLATWRMTKEQLNTACFKIWNSGYRPGGFTEEVTIGSGAN